MIEPERRRRLRGEILEMARRFGVSGVSIEGLEGIYARAGEPRLADNVGEALLYLADKGYVAVNLQRDILSGIERRMVTITAAGIDLLDDTIDQDPGVCIVR
jgi:hypothetical protein